MPEPIEYAVERESTSGKFSKKYTIIQSNVPKFNQEDFILSDKLMMSQELEVLTKKVSRQKRGKSPKTIQELSLQKLYKQKLISYQRNYRIIQKKRYLYYVVPNTNKNTYIEFGINYQVYRKKIHNTVKEEVITLLILVCLLITILPLFFRINLVRPLDNLFEGVRKINAGSLDARVKVDVMDEIGFLTNSFNKMVASIQQAQEQLEDYAKNLEVKVEHRTKELKDSFDKISELKNKQDADYFLSSLLVRPLSQKGFQTANVSVEYIIKQKKEFEFKNRKHEIGGDYCTCIRLNLNDKPCCIILNSDAMGKSLQGNGGIIVLGSLFQSIIARTKTNEYMKNLEPKEWLRTVYNELHSVFISFEGSMLISVFFAVLEEKTGRLYHANAEHPEAVLLRDKTVSFLSDATPEMKIGVELAEAVTIRETMLKPGDIIISGSDGRDDILIPVQENGTVG